eukprot:635723-Amphidinium_carterae.1
MEVLHRQSNSHHMDKFDVRHGVALASTYTLPAGHCSAITGKVGRSRLPLSLDSCYLSSSSKRSGTRCQKSEDALHPSVRLSHFTRSYQLGALDCILDATESIL